MVCFQLTTAESHDQNLLVKVRQEKYEEHHRKFQQNDVQIL